MAKHIQKKTIMKLDDIILFQIMSYCFFNNIMISNNEMKCLMELCKLGEQELSKFCFDVSIECFKSPQSVRNFISKAVSLGLVEKSEGSKKKIKLSNKVDVVIDDAIVIDHRMIYVSKEK